MLEIRVDAILSAITFQYALAYLHYILFSKKRQDDIEHTRSVPCLVKDTIIMLELKRCAFNQSSRNLMPCTQAWKLAVANDIADTVLKLHVLTMDAE